MTPEREIAISYLAAQIKRYRDELRTWLRAPQFIRIAAQGRLIAPIQDLLEDATRLLARLRGRRAATGDLDVTSLDAADSRDETKQAG